MTRRISLGLVLLLAAVWAAPWEGILPHFAAHMLRHMTLVALLAPALVLAAPGLARRARVPVLAGGLVEFLVAWGWHLPQAHAAARASAPVHALEQASFLAAGMLVWAGALAAREPLAGAVGLLLTSMHMTFLGALLVLAPADLYAGTHAGDLAAQQLGGLLMLAIGTPAYLLGGLALVAQSLAERPA